MPPTDPMGHLCLNKTGVGELPKAMGYFFLLACALCLWIDQRNKGHFDAIWDENQS